MPENVLESLVSGLNTLGPTVILPFIIIVVGLVFRLKLSTAIRSGLMIAVAFVGIFLTVGLLGETVGEIGEAFAENTGTGLNIIDIGWPAASSLAFASSVGYLIIPIGIVINIVLIVLRLTSTLDVDLWNYWHIAFVGALVLYVTDSFALAMYAATLCFIIALFLADWSAPLVHKYFNLPGISVPHLQSAGYMLLAVPFAWLLRRIPGLNNLKLNPDMTRRKLGLLGEPMVLGFIIGLALGLTAGQAPGAALGTAVNTAAVMLLIPRMVAILVEGLAPLAGAASTFMSKRFEGREINIGLDAAVLIGNPAVIAAGLLMVPVEILMAIALAPFGNGTLPFVDLADGPFVAALLVPLVGGDLLLTVMLGAIVMGIGLIFVTQIAPAVTQMVQATSSLDLPSGYSNFSVMSDGAVPTSYIFYYLFQAPAGLAVVVSLALVVGLYFLKRHFPLGERLLPLLDTGTGPSPLATPGRAPRRGPVERTEGPPPSDDGPPPAATP